MAAQQTEFIEQKWLQCLICAREFEASDRAKCCPFDASVLVPLLKDSLIGQLLGNKYQVESLIGAGGWSRVYKATHVHLQKAIAVKVLSASLAADPIRLSRFQIEASSTSKLIHRNIVTVYDHGILPQPYIAMEYVAGQTLDQVLHSKGFLPPQAAIEIFKSISDAMHYAHQSGLIHRDLKPSNIMLSSPDNTVKILDFGLVKVVGLDQTHTGDAIGSPAYMSPEQCCGEKQDNRSDIYSLGCLMYETLTGIRCFEGETPVASIYKHFQITPKPISEARKDLSFPKGLAQVVDRCLAREPGERYQTMQQLRLDLAKVGNGTLAPTVLYFRRINPRRVMQRLLSALAFLFLFAIILGLLFVMFFFGVTWLGNH